MYTSTFVLKQKLYFQSPYISEANARIVQKRAPHRLVESVFFLFFFKVASAGRRFQFKSIERLLKCNVMSSFLPMI